MSCLDDAAFSRLLAGRLAEGELAAVDAHLDGCPRCREELGLRARRSASQLGRESLAREPGDRDAGVGSTVAAEVEPAPDPYLGRVIAERYLVRRRLGGGGMGTVYEAEHVLIGRRVALKLLLPQWASKREVVRRFQNEARAAGTLRHPGILEALDMGRTAEGTPYLVLELLEGRDLEHKIAAEAPLPIAEAVGYARAITDAMGAAHAAGIIHRDLKPENVFLTDRGQLKVLDFGISKITSSIATGPMTAPGAVMGTPMYMAPEQFEDAGKADPRSDVYALGVILYRALTGRHPFVAETLPGLLLAIVDGDAPSPTDLRPDVPPSLSAIVMRALAAKPDDRFTTMEEVSAALAPYAEGGARQSGASVAPPADGPSGVRIGRRVVTLLFAEGVGDRAAAEGAIEAHGGRVVPGDHLVALFGEETWHSDESIRAVDAALAIRPYTDAVAVVTGHLRPDSDLARSPLFERAVKLSAAAEDGVAVLASATRLAARFELRDLGSGIVEVLRAVASRGSVLPATEALPLAGRSTERARIAEALDRALTESTPSVLWASGEAGIGKSRLAAEAIAIATAATPRFRVLLARGTPRGGRQLGALSEALLLRAREAASAEGWPSVDPPASLEERRRAVRQLAVEAVGPAAEPDLSEFLGELLGVPMPPSSALSAARSSPRLMRDRKHLALRAYLAGLAAQRPLLVVLEDLQWIDEDSLGLLAELLGAELWGRSAVIFGTARADVWTPAPPFDDPEVAELRLRGLGLAAIQALAQEVLGWAVPEELARRLLERTGGNPLFVEQTVRALAEDAGALDAAARGELPLPLDVEAAVQSRLEALEASELDLVSRAAVLGGSFTVEDLIALGASAPERSAAALVTKGILRRRPGPSPDARAYDFRTSVVGEVLLRNLDEARRRELHLRAAAVWQARGDREWAAYHFERAGEGPAAATEYMGAALEAERLGDGARVLRCADRALALGVSEEAELALQLARATALEHEGRLDEQGVALELAEQLATTAEERAAIAVATAVRRLRRRGPAESLAGFQSAVEFARHAGEPAVLARALGAYATALTMAARMDEAAGVLGEAEMLVMTRAHALRAESASWRAQLAAAQGDLGARHHAFTAALALFEEVGDERARAGVCVNLGDILNRFGAYAEAERTLLDALARCRRLGIRLMEGYALVNLGYARTMSGSHAAARGDLDAARDLADAIGDRHLATWASLYRARLALATGAAEHARHEARILAERAAKTGIGAAEVLARVLEARAALALEDMGAASEAIARASEARDALGGLEEDEGELWAARIRVLDARGATQEAMLARARAQAWLESTARRISDPVLRERFMGDVAAHRELRSMG